MEGIIFLLSLIIAVSITIILSLSSRSNKRKKFNSNVAPSKDGFPSMGVKPVKFEVVKIEVTSNNNSCPVAIYTLLNCYFAKENSKCFVYEHYIMYDSIGKYNLDDFWIEYEYGNFDEEGNRKEPWKQFTSRIKQEMIRNEK